MSQMDSVGFAEDVRLCTRTSMPSRMLDDASAASDKGAVAAPLHARQRVQILLARAQQLRRGSDEYASCVGELAQLVRTHVRPHVPGDVRALFSLAEPVEPFARRAQASVAEQYAWIDDAALRAACTLSVDVSRDSAPPQ